MRTTKPSRILAGITTFTLIISSLAGVTFGETSRAASVRGASGRGEGNSGHGGGAAASLSTLSRYAKDLTRLARRGELSPVAGYDREISRVIRVLSRSAGSNLVLIDDSGAGREAVLEGLAQKIASGSVPAGIRRKRLLRLDLGSVLADAGDSREAESRFDAILAEAEASDGRIILFINELPALFGAVDPQGIALAKKLRGALARRTLHCVTATSLVAYEGHIASEETLARLFEQVRVGNAGDSSEGEGEEERNSTESFAGRKLSPDLQELVSGVGPGTGLVKVILQVTDLESDKVQSLLRRHGVEVTSRLGQLETLAVELPVGAVEELAASEETSYISLDREVKLLGHVETTSGTAAIRKQLSALNLGPDLDGAGIGIAVLDSGVDTAHESFSNSGSGSRNIVSRDFTGEGKTGDPFGHGSHVASLAVGNDRIANGAYVGIAPRANLINLRVLDSNGLGSVSNLLAALDWIMANRQTHNIRVVNMSIGTKAVDSYLNDPLCRAVRRLVDAGIVVVAAAGNDGVGDSGQKAYGQIHSPGNEPSVITIGASDTRDTDARGDDAVAAYSSRGPTRSFWTDAAGVKHYDNLVKPELVAPGHMLVGASAVNNQLVSTYQHLDAGGSGSDRMMYLCGTSMATPITAGAAALLLQANPKLTPNMVKAILMYTAQPLAGFNMLEQGAGQLNVEGAVRLAKLVRTDLSAATLLGAPLLTALTVPAPQTTVAGQSFSWSQGLILGRAYATGSDLVTKYQKIYGAGTLLNYGAEVSAVGNSTLAVNASMMSGGVTLGSDLLISNGTTLGGGTVFCAANLLLNDVGLSDGTVLGDGVIITNGVIISNKVLIGNGVIITNNKRK